MGHIDQFETYKTLNSVCLFPIHALINRIKVLHCVLPTKTTRITIQPSIPDFKYKPATNSSLTTPKTGMSPKTNCLPTTNLTPETTLGSGLANHSPAAQPMVPSSYCSMISTTRIVSPAHPTLMMESVPNQTTTRWDELVHGTANPISPFLLGLLPEFMPYTGCGISPNSQPLIRRTSSCTHRAWTLKLSLVALLHHHLHRRQPRLQLQAATPTIRPPL